MKVECRMENAEWEECGVYGGVVRLLPAGSVRKLR